MKSPIFTFLFPPILGEGFSYVFVRVRAYDIYPVD